MYRFLTTEKRKDIKEDYKEHKNILLKDSYCSQSNEELTDAVHGSLNAVSQLLSENGSGFSRFRNVQNSIYIKLLEQSNKKERNTLLMGTPQM